MNRTEAKKIAETITNQQLFDMFEKAKNTITDWTKVSSVNKGLTKGAGWNILAKDFDINEKYHNLAKINMIREFGDYLDPTLRLPKKIVASGLYGKIHQEPIFNKEK